MQSIKFLKHSVKMVFVQYYSDSFHRRRYDFSVCHQAEKLVERSGFETKQGHSVAFFTQTF